MRNFVVLARKKKHLSEGAHSRGTNDLIYIFEDLNDAKALADHLRKNPSFEFVDIYLKFDY